MDNEQNCGTCKSFAETSGALCLNMSCKDHSEWEPEEEAKNNPGMILTVILGDTHSVLGNQEHLGITIEMKRRAVSVELTEEQVALLSPRGVGKSGKDDAHEEILMTFIENK